MVWLCAEIEFCLDLFTAFWFQIMMAFSLIAKLFEFQILDAKLDCLKKDWNLFAQKWSSLG